jgi:hypothetical protein
MLETGWTSRGRFIINRPSIAWALARFVIARPGSFASEFGFLSVGSALFHQVPQARTLNMSAPRSFCDLILASNAPVSTHARGHILIPNIPNSRHF